MLPWLATILLTVAQPNPVGQPVYLFTLYAARQQPKGSGMLGDVTAHLDPKHGNTYYAADPVVYCHEATHGVNSDIRNRLGQGRFDGFYVGEDRACLIPRPKCRLRQIAAVIPTPLRKSRYDLYLVKQQKDWDDSPLYVLDEWTAYVNGAMMAPEHANNDFRFAPLEMTVYALYVAGTVPQLDRGYDGSMLRAFVQWNAERAMREYRPDFDRGAYLQLLRTSPDAAPLRKFCATAYGSVWAERVMGFTR